MIGEQLIVGFRKDKAYLTTDKALNFDQLGFDQFGLSEASKSFKTEAFWTIRILNFNPVEKKLFVEVLSYQNGIIRFPPNQLMLADQLRGIEKVTFRNLSTEGLLTTLAGKSSMIIFPNRETPVIRHEPSTSTTQEIFFIVLKKVCFKNGSVSFDSKLKSFSKTFNFTILNHEIKEEFDAVKNYFANVLNAKKIKVIATLQITDGNVSVIGARSPEIEKIDKNFIDEVRLEGLKQALKRKNSAEVVKNLFTMEEFIDAFAENGFKSDAFYKNDNDLLEDFIKISNTKHYRNLRFLSSKHAHNVMRLRFVHHPTSFVFLIEGHKNNHIVWETLDTEEATYIWYLDRDISIIPTALKKIDGIMSGMKIYGKNTYISTNNDRFIRLIHDYKDIDGGFVKWKGQLEHILI